MSKNMQPSREAIYAALENVYDPELDDSLIRLGFIDEVEIVGADVTVRYKVPTFWCAPNFTFMMSYDIRDEVSRVPGVRAVTVLVRNNCAEQEINTGINAGLSFQETFGADTNGESLDDLRRIFTEKGFLARQDVLLRRLRQAGLADAEMLGLRQCDVRADGDDLLLTTGHAPLRVRLAAADLARYQHKRKKLGLPHAPDALLFTTLAGDDLRGLDLQDYLRRSRAARLNIAFNSTLCEGLLRATYTPEQVSNTASVGDALLVIPHFQAER